MQTTASPTAVQRSHPSQIFPLTIIVLSILINIGIIVVCLNLSNTIAALDNRTQFGNLGMPVQEFARYFVLLPAIAAALSIVLLVIRHPAGRFIALVLQFLTAVICGVLLLHSWGFFLSFERIVDTVMQNANVTLGFAVAWLIFWLSGRFKDANPLKSTLTNAALIIAMLTLVVLILLADVLGAANAVLATYANPATWVLTLILIVSGVVWYFLIKMGEYFGETPNQREAWQGWLMLSPNIIGFMLFFAGPLLLSFYLSFTNSSVGRTPEFVGLENYANIFALESVMRETPDVTAQSLLSRGFTPLFTVDVSAFNGGQFREWVIGAKDSLFWRSLTNTFLFCLMLVPLSTIPAIGLALVLNSKLPGVKFFRAVYFLPSVAAVVGTALIWRWLYNPKVGFFNYFISEGVNTANSLGASISNPDIQWLTDPSVVLFSVVLLAAWQVVGFNTVLFLAGLQGIPRDMYEAATVDGANKGAQFRYVTVPMLAPTTFFVLVTTLITGLQAFNEPYALFPSIPIPINATTSVYYLYNVGFQQALFGYSSALAWILFALIFMATLVQFRFNRASAYE